MEETEVECQACSTAHESEYVTLDIVDHNDLIRRQASIGPFCKRCAGGILRTMRLHLNGAIEQQRKANSVELQRQRLQERGVGLEHKLHAATPEIGTPFDLTR